MNILNEFKVSLQTILEKQGSSLEELENDLANNDLAAVSEKMAGMADMLLQGGKTLAIDAPELALALSAVLGTVGGGGLYAVDNHLHNQDNRLKVKQDEVDRVKLVSNRLKEDHNLR